MDVAANLGNLHWVFLPIPPKRGIKNIREQDQNIWGECGRLLANCIIYYNASILSNMLAYREVSGKDSDVLKHISPVAWQHINLYCRYEFNIKSKYIDMDAIILKLAKFKIVPNE
ncbi:Tn3 family transposase [Clostridium tagluense]|uniref:Tn3 family transposase n=1 Tax=Clostridium tagluense TaxID=360422 RepID=UPI00271533BD|nr:Tn3 family transposase [Clostridium tagluense]